MPLQFTTIEEPSFSRGIDARSAENQIRDGFVRDLVNADIVEGRVKKRKGYAPFAGNIPLRVTRYFQPAANKAIVSLDSSIDLSRVESRPILIYGKISTSSGLGPNDPFYNDTNHSCWFTKWETNLRKIFLKGGLPEKSITATPAEHSIPTQSMYVGVSENIPNLANPTDVLTGDLLTTSVTVKADRTIQVDYVNSRTTDVPVFLYYLDRTPVAGTTFTSDVLTGFLNYEISAATHGLSTSNIMYQLYQVEDITGNWIQCKPDAFYAKEDGSVKVVVSSSANKYKLVLSSVPDSQTDEGGDGFTLTNQANSYLFYTCYEELTSGPEFAAGYTRSAVEPDTVQYDDTDKTTTFSFDPASAVSNIRFVYEYGIIRTNEIYLSSASPSGIGASTRSTSPAFSAMASVDTAPQMTLYGIGHDVAYGDQKRQYRRGWVNHIDSYRSPSTAHIVAGLGGNLYAEREQSLAPTNFRMPTYYPELFARVSTKTILGPAFSGANNDRTRGVYSFTGGGDGLAEVTKVAYNATSNKVVYTLNVPGFAITPAATPIDANDFLTVDGMSYKRHNGTFQISAPPTVVDANTITISVSNPDVDSTDYDDANTSGYAGVFTDRFTATASSPFLVGDRLLSSSWDDSTTFTISSVNATAPTVVYFSGCIKRLELGNNLAVTGQRTSATIPLRTVSRGANNESVNYLISGDTVSVSGINDPLQIVSVDAVNKTITLDRIITWSDTISLPTTISVAARWLPVEAPTLSTDGALIPQTSVRYFTSNDYENQAFLRSAMVQNNLYLTNGSDEVYKYDGENNYRAGIIPWQPGLFLTVESVASGGIPLAGMTPITPTAFESPAITVTKSDSTKFVEGNIYLYKDNTVSQYLTLVSNVESDASHHHLLFKETLNLTTSTFTGSPTLTLAYNARYYFRLNIKDVNGVVTASAVTGAEDFVALIAPATGQYQKVHLRLIGLPAWDQYDFRNKNIELQIYRTFWTTGSVGEVPVFYNVATKACSFTGADGYIDFIDVYGNDTLTEPDLVVSTQSPSVIPAGWDEPPRAKCVTTAGNRLVLANLTDWPTLSLSYLSDSTVNTPFNGQKLTFKKDYSTAATATDMVNVATYELTTSAGTTLTTGSFASATGGFKITLPGINAAASGNWVYIALGSAVAHPLDFCGWWQINSATNVGGNTECTILSTKTYAAPTHSHVAVFATDKNDIPVNINTDYNLGMYNGQVVGFTAPIPRIIRRIGMAINTTMRMVDTKLTPYAAFKPWIVARSESDTIGQLIVKQPRAEQALPAVIVTNPSSSVSVYVNGNLSGGEKIPATVTRYPSRLAVSYDNYPEIFDSLWVVNTDDSDSVIDVNSADGQEITGVIPFFGESAFGAAQKAGVLVVFKQNSIYLVNIANKLAGTESVQRLETQGLGCTAPYSIAPTKNGIMFANESGIYALRTDQRIEYLGRFMERNWQEKVDLGALAIAQGHHYGVGRQYKLSVPMSEESSASYAENSQVYVYNHTAEADGELGGWTRYTNHPVTGWANLFQDAFLASANGSVMKVRNLGGVTDYRDGNVAIESILAARANAFGNTGIRKSVSNLVVHYRSGANSEYTQVYMSPDFFEEYQLSTKFQIESRGIPDGLSTAASRSVISVVHSFPRRRCVYMSIKITNNGIDDNVEIAGMSYIVAGLSSAGIKQAAETY